MNKQVKTVVVLEIESDKRLQESRTFLYIDSRRDVTGSTTIMTQLATE